MTRHAPSLRGTLPWRALALAALAAMAGPAGAQSLRELYDAARAYDATYLAARSSAEAAQFRVNQAEAGGMPTASLNAAATSTRADPPGDGGTFGTNTQNGTLNGRYPLYNRSTSSTIEQARRAVEVSAADLALAEQDLIVRVAQAYFDVLAAQDSLSTAQASKKAIGEQLASAKRNFEVGTATITDTREAQARFDLATAAEIAADNDLRTKRIALDQLVGRPGTAPKALATPVVLPTLAPANVEDWVARSSESPNVRKANAALEIARLDTTLARATDSPTLDLVGSIGASHSTGSALTASRSATGTTKSASVGLQFAWPLYTGGLADARVKEKLTLEEKSRNDLEAARRAVAQATRVVYFGVQSGKAQVSALEAAESSSKLALEATQLGYKVGVRVNLDVLNAQTQLFTTQRDLAKARYDVIVNGLKLRQAAGALKVEDVDAVNGLLTK